MKNSFFVVLGLLGLAALPERSALALDAAGHVFYKVPEGQLAVKDVVLELPPRGEGDVLLKSSELPSNAVKAEAFTSKQANGRVVFYVAFPVPTDSSLVAVFKGTYVRGTNLAVYSGDIFQAPRQNFGVSAGSALAKENLSQFDGLAEDAVRYVGGFGFRAPVPPQP